MTYCLLTALACACSGPAAEPAPPVESEPPVAALPAGPGRAELLAAADARRLAGLLTSAAAHPDAEVRSTAMLGIARLHDPDATPLLLRALRDPDPSVRAHASLGLGAFETHAAEGVARALLAALAAEADPEVRPLLLEDLGRLGVPETLAALPTELAADQPRMREAACRAAGAHALAGRTLPDEILTRLAARVADESSLAVRQSCAYALSRAPVSADAATGQILADQLSGALRDPDPDVRVFLVRALGRLPATSLETLLDATRDADWRVAVHALRALTGRVGVPAAQRRALLERAVAAALAEDGSVRAGGPVHVLLTAFEMAAGDARSDAVHQLAGQLHERLGRVPTGVPPGRDAGLLHCAAAELVDRGRGWPARVTRCGLEQISQIERDVMAARILADVEGAEAQRVVFLRRLAQSDEPRVREAALAAVGSIAHPDATALLRERLMTDTDPGVLTTALDALRGVLAREASARMDAVLSGADPAASGADPAMVAALRRASATLRGLDDLEGLVTLAGALEDAGLPGLTAELEPLAQHRVLAVRAAARAALESLGASVAETTPSPPDNPLPSLEVLSGQRRVRVETDRGTLLLELDADLAPTTVARFLSLVERGFYTDLPFHRVVSAFVVQGGDPRGDGYGGPGWSQRCEDGRTRYQRGTVGMALAGRDTGGSQFFIAHGAQPHLEGRYTAFGRVVDGLDIVDQIQAGDRIREVALVPDGE